ncbi:fad-dependent monooxygenase [Colletotrichum incanum]|uniref:Fad-dependent monooxygenase n=1 Tax=Colletotrichum incanum TaxID=1573173 RepID=A0A161W9S9_COLIC|nr:fad-dependent monooxygenase [Colletotrichum incanum]OHW94193.1 FAD-dependent monooxygenase [Colletotrichum incanum]
MLARFSIAASLLFGHISAEVACKTTPFDATWPNTEEWNAFNQSLGGALLKTQPVASSCYENNPFNSTLSCDEVDENWSSSAFHARFPESIDYPYWANSSCVPPSDYGYKNQGCQLGGLPEFILNAATERQVSIAMKWAGTRNIRVIAKGTGHDLNGRSSGAYSLLIWTHQFRTIKLDAEWPRPLGNRTENVAIIGSGINWGSVLKAASTVGRTLVSGQVSTVGLGGFIGGGGHGPLSSQYGLAADQVLQATIVTPNGDVLVVNEAQNQDLLWAIRGGGPGSYGVVTEYVLRTHPIPQNVVQTTLSMSMAGNNTEAAMSASWSAMATLSSCLPDLMDAGIAGFGNAVTTKASKLSSKAFSQGIEASFTLFGYNTTADALVSALEPIKSRMIASGSNRTLSVTISKPTVFPTYLSFFENLNKSPEQVGQISLISSRLLGRKELTDIPLETLRSHLQNISKSQIEGNPSSLIFGMQGGVGPAQAQPDMRGAVNPAWRSAYIHLISAGAFINTTDSAPQDALASAAAWTEENKEAVWRQWAPGSGSYINEANPFNSNFQEDFYGGNYDRLVQIKEKYDPFASMYVLSGVGSHLWEYDLNTGKLCRH